MLTDSIRDTQEKANLFCTATVFYIVAFVFGEFMKEYRTVEFENCDEFIEKKSRFIGYVKPVKTAEEATQFINSIKSKHWDATHNVSAYVLRENNIQRSSDDGEPSGTAGVPVLDVLLKENLVDLCVVVTRYFGGTLLGAGGLIRAYSHASKLAVNSGKIITMAPCKILYCSIDYSFFDRFNILINDMGASIENTEFADSISITFTVKAQLKDELSRKLTEISNGKYTVTEVGEKFAKINE